MLSKLSSQSTHDIRFQFDRFPSYARVDQIIHDNWKDAKVTTSK